LACSCSTLLTILGLFFGYAAFVSLPSSFDAAIMMTAMPSLDARARGVLAGNYGLLAARPGLGEAEDLRALDPAKAPVSASVEQLLAPRRTAEPASGSEPSGRVLRKGWGRFALLACGGVLFNAAMACCLWPTAPAVFSIGRTARPGESPPDLSHQDILVLSIITAVTCSAFGTFSPFHRSFSGATGRPPARTTPTLCAFAAGLPV
jgi:hypothetical protein